MMKRRWKFAVETDEGHGYLTGLGELVHDSAAAEDWIGTSREADAEALRRADAYDDLFGGNVDRIIYESQGRVTP